MINETVTSVEPVVSTSEQPPALTETEDLRVSAEKVSREMGEAIQAMISVSEDIKVKSKTIFDLTQYNFTQENLKVPWLMVILYVCKQYIEKQQQFLQKRLQYKTFQEAHPDQKLNLPVSPSLDFVSTYSHDVLNKLTPIRGYAELLLYQTQSHSSEMIKSFFDVVTSNVEKLVFYNNGINLKEGKLVLQLQTIDEVEKVIDENVKNDSSVANEKMPVEPHTVKKIIRGQEKDVTVTHEMQLVLAHVQIKHSNEQTLKRKTYLDVLLVSRVLDNIAQNLHRQLKSQIGRKIAHPQEEVKFVKDAWYTLDAREEGVYFVVDDNGDGFPITEKTEPSVSRFDGKPISPYTATRGKTSWGEGTSLASLKELIESKSAEGAYFLTGNLPEGGARIEIFFPYVTDKTDSDSPVPPATGAVPEPPTPPPAPQTPEVVAA